MFRPLMLLLMRHAPRLGRGLAFARTHLAARAYRFGTYPSCTAVQAMGLEFPNPLGVAAGFDRTGRLGWRAQTLGFGCIELGTLTPQQAAMIAHNPPSPRPSRIVIGINVGLPPRTDLSRAASTYMAGLRAAWPAADYLAINLGSPQASALTQPARVDELKALLASLTGERDRLTALAGRRVPLAVKLRLDLDAPLPTIVPYLAGLGIDGIILASDAGPPASPERYVGCHDPRRQQLACRQVAQACARLEGRLSLISVGGIVTAEHAEARMKAGAVLVQMHDALVYEGPRVALGMLRDML